MSRRRPPRPERIVRPRELAERITCTSPKTLGVTKRGLWRQAWIRVLILPIRKKLGEYTPVPVPLPSSHLQLCAHPEGSQEQGSMMQPPPLRQPPDSSSPPTQAAPVLGRPLSWPAPCSGSPRLRQPPHAEFGAEDRREGLEAQRWSLERRRCHYWS